MSRAKVLVIIVSLALFALLLYNYQQVSNMQLGERTDNEFVDVNSSKPPNEQDSRPQKIAAIKQNLDKAMLEITDSKLDERHIIECETELSLYSKDYIALVEQQINAFANSSVYDQKLTYALFSISKTWPDQKTRLDLLFDLDEQFPNESLVLMDTLNLCASNEHPKCTAEFVEYAIASDRQNGAMWLKALLVHASQGNDEAVLDSIAGLDKADLFSERYGARILQFADAVSSSKANSFGANVAYGIGVGAARMLSYDSITKWCSAGTDNVEKASACLTLGRNLEQRSPLMFTKQMGLAIQGIVYEGEQNTTALNELEKRSSALANTFDAKEADKAFNLLMRDEKFLKQWLTNIEAEGEVQAFQILVDEAIKVSHYVGEAFCDI